MKKEPHDIYSKAKRMVERQLGFFIHLAIYFVVNASLVFLNSLLVPEKVWWIYPFLSWGLAIYFHFLFAFVFHEENTRKWNIGFGSRRKVEAMIQLGVHTASYAGVCFFLLMIDVVSGDRYFWSIWAILGWGVGLLAHGVSVWVFTFTTFREWASRIRGDDLIETRFFFKLHTLIFLVANGLISLLNFLILHHFRYSLWVFLGWGIGLFCHGLWVFVNKGHRVKKWRQKKTLELMRKWEE